MTVHSDADRGTLEVFGDPANVAKRLCDLNVHVVTRVLASEPVVVGLHDRLILRRISEDFLLKGVADLPRVFEIVGCAS